MKSRAKSGKILHSPHTLIQADITTRYCSFIYLITELWSAETFLPLVVVVVAVILYLWSSLYRFVCFKTFCLHTKSWCWFIEKNFEAAKMFCYFFFAQVVAVNEFWIFNEALLTLIIIVAFILRAIILEMSVIDLSMDFYSTWDIWVIDWFLTLNFCFCRFMDASCWILIKD